MKKLWIVVLPIALIVGIEQSCGNRTAGPLTGPATTPRDKLHTANYSSVAVPSARA